MPQVTWRAPEELIERVRLQAQQRGRSLNDWVTAILDAATDPATAGGEAERVRERLARAGLLDPAPVAPRRRPNRELVAQARAAAGDGTSLSDLVGKGRG